ncbi:MAG: GNAT family N-acetyltransferase [Alphaproteobacteria bacterium]|nr:GNAT family N-acetyltransferase [Alphaproteobacteria bacterium]
MVQSALQIREAVAEDRLWLQQVSPESNAAWRDAFGEDPPLALLIAEWSHQAVGYLAHHPGYNVETGQRGWHIIDLWVLPSHRRLGVASALFTIARHQCRQSGGGWMTWTIDLSNTAAQAFYQRHGAHVTSGLRIMHVHC